jgi:hypothetical protein
MISSEHATYCAEMICSIPFTPSTGGVLTAVAAELRAMCETPEQAMQLAQRMTRMYRVWPGVAEIRWFYCQTNHPLDGISPSGESMVYPDGLPPERDAATDASLAGPPPPKRLSAAECTAAESVQETITDLAKATKLSRVLDPAPIIRPVATKRPEGRITQADIDAAVAAHRAAKLSEETP